MKPAITGFILAGGRARRMSEADKGLVLLEGIPLYQHIVKRLSPQVDSVMIGANRNIEDYQKSELKVVADTLPGFCGPLAGMLAGLLHAPTEWMVFAPCDTPDLPDDLVLRLWQQKENTLAAYACDAQRSHPTCALLHISLATEISDFLGSGQRKLILLMEKIAAKAVLFPNTEAFHNLNTLEDCQQWERNKQVEK